MYSNIHTLILFWSIFCMCVIFVQVESLQALIKDKMEDYSELLSAKEQCQRDVEERNEEIEKLATRIRELEQALLSCTEASRSVTQLEQELQKARKNLQELTQVHKNAHTSSNLF